MSKILEVKTKGIIYKVILDEDDFYKLSKNKWYMFSSGYIGRNAIINGKNVTIFIHREIMNPCKENDIDHINRNKLDNRKENLREVSHKKNTENRKIQNNNNSGYNGVCWSKQKNKWKAQITHNQKHIHLGFFVKIEDAIHARNKKEHELNWLTYKGEK